MDWIQGIQRALDYIEAHLTGELDYGAIAREAACSACYFQRLFGVLCGMSLGEYIRARRLTLAGRELAAGDAKVIDVALKYGYESPESFARAFQRFHGVTPSEARRDGSLLRSFAPLTVQITLKGGTYMDYRIEEKPAFTLLERVERHSVVDGENLNTIPDFWTRARADGTIEKLLDLALDRTYIFGVCYGNEPTDSKTFDYAIAAACDPALAAPDGLRVREMPARTWAVFPCKGAMPGAVQQLWHRIITEFFPGSAWEPTYELDIEAYPGGDMESPDYTCEIWVPVKKA